VGACGAGGAVGAAAALERGAAGLRAPRAVAGAAALAGAADVRYAARRAARPRARRRVRADAWWRPAAVRGASAGDLRTDGSTADAAYHYGATKYGTYTLPGLHDYEHDYEPTLRLTLAIAITKKEYSWNSTVATSKTYVARRARG